MMDMRLLGCWALAGFVFELAPCDARSPSADSLLSARELVEIRDLSGVSAAPNGAYAVVRLEHADVESNEVHLAWYRIPLEDSGQPQRIAGAGGVSRGENGVAEQQTPVWSQDSQWFYYRALHDEQMQVWRTRWDGASTEQVTRDAANVKAFALDEARGRLYYTVGATRVQIVRAEQQQYDDGILNDGSLIPGFGVGRSFPSVGRPSMYRRYREANSGDRHDGLLADQPDRLLALSFDTESTHPATASEVAQFEALSSRQAAAPLDIHCKGRACEADGTVLGNNRYGRGRCALAQQEAICVASGPAQPPLLLGIALEGGESRVLFAPNSHIESHRLGVAERLFIRNKYGEEAVAILVMPRNRTAHERLPLVITSYSCDGFLRGGSGDDVPEHVLAGFGIAAICIADSSVVQHADIAGAPQERAQKSSLAFREAAVEMLDRRGLIDAKRVAISGLSYGATVALYAISHSNRFAVAEITSQGYGDQLEAYLYGASDVYRNLGASPFLRPEYFTSISPALNADKIHVPLLMQLADTEYLQMMQLYSNLRDLQRPVEMFVYPDEYHIKQQPRHRLAVYEKSVAWMRFWLQGHEEQGASLEPMYRRWRKLRE